MEIQVHDVLFKKNRYTTLEKVTVTKITPTGNMRLSDGSLIKPDLRKKTTDPWDDTMYFAWSDELESQYELVQLRNDVQKQLKEMDINTLSKHDMLFLLDTFDKINAN